MQKTLSQMLLAFLLASLFLSACGTATPAPISPTQTGTAPATATPAPTMTTTPLPPSPTATPTRVPLQDFMKGISYVQWDRGGFTSQASDRLLGQSIPQTGATWIALIVTCNQATIDSTDITCAHGPTDEETIHAIQAAHAAGLRVMLKPHLDLSEDFSHWRGEIGSNFNAEQWQAWFVSYTAYIAHFASLAQSQDVDAFVVGTEMVTPSTHDAEWRAIIAAVRAEYAGPLTYAAIDNEFSLTWWDALDMIGVDAYYPLTDSAAPTREQMVAGWQSAAGKLEALSARWDKPILFTEIGYQSMDRVNITPTGVTWANPLDLQEQADCYAAAFEVFSGKPWWRGAFWWVVDTNAAQGGGYDKGFSPLGKPAEDVLRQYYGAPARPQPAALPALDPAAVQQVEWVYDDSLRPGWEDWSWGVQVDLQNTDHPQDGSRAMSLTYHDNEWDTLSLHHEALDLSGFTWLEFYIWSETEDYAALRVELISDADLSYHSQPLIFDPAYVEGGQRLAGQWQRVLIPLSMLGPDHPRITRLNFFLDGQFGTTVQLDQIRFLQMDP
ncbi:MAG: glycoside hydrolase family 113 [Chloroflexota bacterium]